MSRSAPGYGELAGWYDALYEAAGKDYDAEAATLLDLVRAERGAQANPRSVLDVACGTGRHLAAFASGCDELVGVDSSPEMLAIAASRLGPEVPLVEADFRAFSLGRTFDLVTCLFSSIGHVADGDELDAAIATMARHVAPGPCCAWSPG